MLKSCKGTQCPIKITVWDKNARGRVFFRVYQQVQSGLSANRAHIIFSSPTLDISPAGKRSSAKIYTKVPRWNGKDEIIMSRTRRTYMRSLWIFSHIYAVTFTRLLLQLAARSVLIGSFAQMLLALEYMLDASNYLFTWNVRILLIIPLYTIRKIPIPIFQ